MELGGQETAFWGSSSYSHYAGLDPAGPPPSGYLQCLRNHAATTGGTVLDGCREFMPRADDLLACAACDCHRSFHLKAPAPADAHLPRPSHPPPRPISLRPHAAEPSSLDVSDAGAAGRRKRYRTKFGAEQKERMREFAERLGWRMHSRREEEIRLFCAEVGVGRQVFKVWMHNNKNPAKHRIRRPPPPPLPRAGLED